MKRALLISIHPEWAEKILNGEKTIEIRTWIPKDYVGWVYVAITKDNYKNHLYKKDGVWTLTDKHIFHYPYKNICGKVAFRFWYESYQTIKWEQNYYEYVAHDLLLNACLTNEQVKKYGKGRTLYAWHIDNLEVFDKPKELSEFWSEPIDFSIHTRAEALAEGYKPIQRAPQKCAWVYGGEQS